MRSIFLVRLAQNMPIRCIGSNQQSPKRHGYVIISMCPHREHTNVCLCITSGHVYVCSVQRAQIGSCSPLVASVNSIPNSNCLCNLLERAVRLSISDGLVVDQRSTPVARTPCAGSRGLILCRQQDHKYDVLVSGDFLPAYKMHTCTIKIKGYCSADSPENADLHLHKKPHL